jgi:hypothetical protein
MSDTPTAHLVLTVPPEIAVAWERLEPEHQGYWSTLIVHGWLRYILEPKQGSSLPTVRAPTLEQIHAMPVDELGHFVAELERKFGLQARGDSHA